MIVVISDLHFEEEASDVIPGRGGRSNVICHRNLNPRAYRNFVAQMAEQVARRKVKEFQLSSPATCSILAAPRFGSPMNCGPMSLLRT